MAGERLEATVLAADGAVGDRGWALRDEEAGEIRGAKKIPRLMLCAARYLAEPSEPAGVPHVRIDLPDGRQLSSADADASSLLSEFLGRRVTLWPRRPAEDLDHYRRQLPESPMQMESELREMFGRTADEPLPDLSMFPPELMQYTSPLGTYLDAFPVHLVTTSTLARLAQLNREARFDVRRFRPNLVIATDDASPGFVEAEWCGRRVEIGEAVLRCEMPTVRCSMTTHAQDGLPKDPSVLRTIVREARQNVGVYASVERGGRIVAGDPVVLR